jgi:alpha-tubulin suppressor-like RCC1 family protein
LIRPDGTLAAFGLPGPVLNVPSGSYRTVTVSALHAVAIANDGKLQAWGADIPNVLDAPAGKFKEVGARVLYSIALRDDGTLFGWGESPVLQGSGWTETSQDPAIRYVPGEKFKGIAAGNFHALAIRPDGTVTGWGNGTGGALEPPPGVRFKAVAAGWGFSVGLAVDGTLWGWGTPVFITTPFPTSEWTFASQGWTRYGETNAYFFPGERFKSIAAAAFHLMAITARP